MEKKGWWRIAVSNKVLAKLDTVKEEIEKEEGESISYNTLMVRLLQRYRAD